jgi:hypothetical protein
VSGLLGERFLVKVDLSPKLRCHPPRRSELCVRHKNINHLEW